MSEGEQPTSGEPTAEDLEDLYENAPCGYISIQPNGRIVKVNLTFSSWIGYTREQLLGTHLHALLNIAGRIFFETHFAPLLRMQGSFDEVALDLVTQQGVRLPVLINARERRDPDGRHIFTRLTIFNATDRRRYERQLLEAREAAEASRKEIEALRSAEHAVLLEERATAKLREQFIAVLGHDLRNPLASILAGVRLLTTEPVGERGAFALRHMQQSGVRMAGLIDNVLDFARGRLGGGLSLVQNAELPLFTALEQIVTELRTAWPDRVIETAIAITCPVHCDVSRIGQLLSNLLGNAIAHGAPDQPIHMRAFAGETEFTLSVSNAGPPIPAASMDHLFQPFFRGAAQSSAQGLGLGLYIVSEIARAHAGTMDVQSTDAGTCFTFKMPNAPAHTTQPRQPGCHAP